MCRLFGINAGTATVHASFWLRSAPDSVTRQSRRNPDGAGIGWFNPDGQPHVDKQPGEALRDRDFQRDARTVDAHTIVTHVRAATAGGEKVSNTHPFLVDGTLIAHNGGFGDLEAVDAHLGDDLALVHGDTDSERFAALIAREARARDGDIAAGIVAAATWISRNVPMYSLNVVAIRDGWLWALRYPDERALHYARRAVHPGSGRPDDGWSGSSSVAAHQVISSRETPVVVVASERIDASEDWLMLTPGELITVDPSLQLTSTLALREAPAHLEQLEGHDANDEAF